MKENSQQTWWLASLLIFLCFPATALIQEYSGLVGIAIYVMAVFLTLLVMLRFENSIYNLVEKRYAILVGLLVVGLVAVFAIIYPLETSGKLSRGSDRDEALNIAVISLAEGRYPYYERTQLGGQITPLPGAILLSAPFVVLGNSAYQNLFWLLVFLYATSVYLKNKVSALILLVTALTLSPAVQYEFISGGDLLANSIYVIVFIFLTVRAFSKPNTPAWVKLASSVALGIGFASRPNFFLLLPLLFAFLARRANLKLASACVATGCLSAGLIILPFYLFDPKSFTPLTAGNKLAEFDTFIPFASIGVIVITIGLSIIFALMLARNSASKLNLLFFWMSAIIQFVPLFCGVVLETLIKGHLDFSFMHDRYGLMFLFFGLWGCWPNLYHHAYQVLPADGLPLSIRRSSLPQVNILGVGINTITLAQALDQILTWIEQRASHYVCVCTVHTVMECQRNETVRRAVNRAGLATPDGMPLVWLSRWQGQAAVSRVYGPDLMLALCQLSVERGYSHYFYGGAAGVSALLADKLQIRFPGLKVAGTCSPPFRPPTPAEDAKIVAQINQADPDIIWVGLGTPKQDLWMATYREQLSAPVLIGVGAAFDFHTGRLPQAPKWMQRSGLEWLFRLWQEPKRLWYRYLVYNPLFVLHIIAQILGLKHYSIE